MYKTPDGIPFTAKQEFISDEDMPMYPAPGYPKVYLRDKEKNKLSVTVAVPSSLEGEWSANVSVPHLGIDDTTELELVWVFRESDGATTRVREAVAVEPEVEARISDIVVMDDDTEYTLTLAADPLVLDHVKVTTYQWNTAIDSKTVARSELRTSSDRVALDVSVAEFDASLTASLILARLYRANGKFDSRTIKIWKITPQIAVAMSHIEDQINRARISNIIPELEYTSGDLLSYLERGLYMFNAIGYTTSFTGTNMQGPLLDGWLLCSSYYALCAQHLAEGQLAFDFGGQGVSLNVDRTPAIEAFIGRLQSDINERVVPLKKQISRQGIISGDGSIGAGTLRNPKGQVRLGMINAPTTYIPLTANVRFGGRRS